MGEYLVLSSIIVSVLAILGTYMIIQLVQRENKSQKRTIHSLISLICSFTLGNIFIALSPLFQDKRPILGSYTLIGLELAVLVLFSLDLFSRSISGIKLNGSKKIANIIIYASASVFIFLPTNHWDTISIYELNQNIISTQPISHIILILLSINSFGVSIMRLIRVEKSIHEDALKESIKWIKRSLIVLFLYVPSFILNLISYVLEPEPDLEIMMGLYFIGIFIGTITGCISLFIMYLGITLPDFAMKRLYKRYLPMWDQGEKQEKEREEFMRHLKKLQDSLFD